MAPGLNPSGHPSQEQPDGEERADRHLEPGRRTQHGQERPSRPLAKRQSDRREGERQRQKGRKPDLKPEELLSLAVTGWLQGSPSAESRPDVAIRLWRARQLVLAYQRTADAGERQRLLKDFEQEQSNRVGIDEVMQLVPFLPPAEAATDLTAKPAEVKLGAGRDAVTYTVQLPPEYRHGRSYPVLLALPDAGEKADKVLGRWAEAAA